VRNEFEEVGPSGIQALTGYDIPCAKTGLCSDCDSPQRICNIWNVSEGQIGMQKGRIHVKLVGENLGYMVNTVFIFSKK
jgi:hypothetical protein